MIDEAFAAGRTLPRSGATGSIRFVLQTGFYPLYDGDNDQVDPVGPVRRARFQRIIPRYRLSASETNDTGLGPPFYAVPVYSPAKREEGSRQLDEVGSAPGARGNRLTRSVPGNSGTAAAPMPAPEPWRGTQIDLYA